MKHVLATATAALLMSSVCSAGTRTWDGKYDTQQIEVTVVYFVPADRRPLVDWRDRIAYFCGRLKQFHAREFQGQSSLQTIVHPTPLISESTTRILRAGDVNALCFRTLGEVDRRTNFAQEEEHQAFPILLVLSDINWKPLDDFYRLRPQDGKFVFEGIVNKGQHYPGARSGGSRATYLADRGVGWGLVSADGWRVPYRGSDNVPYHEGCGHTVGLPHPEPINDSVMGAAQYRGWLSESWLDKEQKIRLGWEPEAPADDPQTVLFTTFRALPQPVVPQPGQKALLKLNWPDGAKVSSLRVRFQTAIDGPWMESPQQWVGDAPETAVVATFDRETPVSYRVDATLNNGTTAELWGYFQVLSKPGHLLLPRSLSPDLIVRRTAAGDTDVVASFPENATDLLALVDPATCWTLGEWSKADGVLQSPKRLGARLELPYSPPEEYRLTLIVEPLDSPHGLILGLRGGDQRFVSLFNFARGEIPLSAIENIDGRNVGNETTFAGSLFRVGQLSQVIVDVRRESVTMSVDGRTIVNWKGNPERLSLSDYWDTPQKTALFVGAYDCRYRFHRITLETVSGKGRVLAGE